MTNQNIEIKLGNSKKSEIGFIQNIDIYYNGEKIVKDKGVVLVINKTDSPIPIATNFPEKEKTRYINQGQAYVGDIFIDSRYQGKGLAREIYQKIADELNVEILRGDTISDSSKKMWAKFGNKISPNGARLQ